MNLKAVLAAALLTFSGAALAESYPNKPVTIIVNSTAGGSADSIGRALAEELTRNLGQPFVVENRAGAGGVVGLQALARAKPDGYTLSLAATTPLTYGRYTMPRLPFDPQRDFAYISHLVSVQLILAVRTDVPVKSLRELIDWVRKNRGKVSYGHFAVGGSGHLISSYLDYTLKLGMTDVVYKGEVPMIQDLVGGQILWGAGTKGSLAPYFQTDRLRPLVVFGQHRFPDMPDLPTMAEEGFPGPEFLPIGGFGLMAPAGTPPEVLNLLEKEVRKAASTTRMKALYQVYGLGYVVNSSAEFQKSIEDSWPIVEKLVNISGFKPAQ